MILSSNQCPSKAGCGGWQEVVREENSKEWNLLCAGASTCQNMGALGMA